MAQEAESELAWPEGERMVGEAGGALGVRMRILRPLKASPPRGMYNTALLLPSPS